MDNVDDNGSDFSDNSGNDFYEIDTDSDNEELPSYPITNMQMTFLTMIYLVCYNTIKMIS